MLQGETRPNTAIELTPPRALLQMIAGAILTQAIHTAAQLNIADLVKDGPRSLEELSEATGIPARSLSRLLRALVAAEIFVEVEPARFGQSEISSFLRSDHPDSLHNWALLQGIQWQWRPWEAFLFSLQTEKPGFDHVYGMPVWQYFGQGNPDAGRLFNASMTDLNKHVILPIASSYDFASFQTLVDVGGGEGILLRTILRKYPMLNGVLFDQPSVIEKARGRFEQEGLNERCTFVPGDFFVSIPQGADAYLLKNIIIDWQDEQAISILRHCRQAMKPQSKLLIVETLFTPEGMLFEKLVNLQLLLSFGAGSGERTSEQFRQIFEAAGLKMTAIIPTGSQYSIFEAVPA